MIRFLICTIFASQSAFGKVFTPCELAQNIYEIVTRKYGVAEFAKGKQEGLGVMVCIGGYHKFNSSSIVVTDDGRRREGIFGLIPPNCNQTQPANRTVPNFTDDDVTDDVEFLFENVLYVKQDDNLVRNSFVYDFYEDLCDKFSAGVEIFCRINDYAVGNVPVMIPQDDKLLYGKCYQSQSGPGVLRRCQIDSLLSFDDGPVIFPPPMRTIGIRSPTTLNSTSSRNSTDVY